MSPAAPVPGELGAFLKACRARLTPREAGLPATGSRRKVAGLRREEVAQLAAISVDYYTRLEQGRVQASASALATLARALRLDDDQQSYLYALAGKTDARRRRRRTVQRMRPAMQRLLDAVAALRMEAAKEPDDSELAQLVGDLSVQDPDFRTWWAEHHVNSASYGTKHYHHPTVGDLTLDCDTWDSPDGSGQRLMVLTAEPGTPAHDALRILTSWGAGDGAFSGSSLSGPGRKSR